MEPLPCKNNWDFAYVNGFSVFTLALYMVTLMLQVFVGERIEDNPFGLEPRVP